MRKPELPARVRQFGRKATKEGIQHTARQPSTEPDRRPPQQPPNRQQAKHHLKQYTHF